MAILTGGLFEVSIHHIPTGNIKKSLKVANLGEAECYKWKSLSYKIAICFPLLCIIFRHREPKLRWMPQIIKDSEW